MYIHDQQTAPFLLLVAHAVYWEQTMAMYSHLACQSVPVLNLLEAPEWLAGRTDELERAIGKGWKRDIIRLYRSCTRWWMGLLLDIVYVAG
jgi:hypothetical protein